MRLPRTYQRIAALLALLGVLFTQFAVAAYACPHLMGGEQSGSAMQMPAESTSAAMGTGCAQIDQANPNLCVQYSQFGSQSLDHHAGLHVAPALVASYLVARQDVSAVHSAHSIGFVPDLLERNTAPPLSIRNCCFRI